MKLPQLVMNFFVAISILLSNNTFAAEPQHTKKSNKQKNNLKLNTLKIQGNKELPKALYIVPWQEIEIKKGSKYRQQLVLHSLYGDLFDPITSNKLVDKQP